MTLDELYAKATHIRCAMCSTSTRNDEGRITFLVESEADLDDAYDDMDCCDDPVLEAEIVSERPMFPPHDPDSEANQDAYVAANPRLGLYSDSWHYLIGDDLLDVINGRANDDVLEGL